MNAQNQQYYEFQWRVLNLCAEFYGAAEELVVTNLFRLILEKVCSPLYRKGQLPSLSLSAIIWVRELK